MAAVTAGLLVLGTLGSATGAAAATTVGSTFAPDSVCFGQAITILQTASPPGNSYAVPAAGVLTSWSYQAGNQTPEVKLKVARATVDPDAFTIVGESALKTAVASTVNTYTDVSIRVQAGDFLGLRLPAGNGCGDIAGGSSYVSRYFSQDPAPGSTISVAGPATDDIRLDVSATIEPDLDGDGLGDETQDADDDADGVPDASDNCPALANPGQADVDGDGQGDACDADDDGDGVADGADNCPAVANPGQADADGDGQGDACDDRDGDGTLDAADNCPATVNPGQADGDGDGLGDACDADDDGDGIDDTGDACPLAPGLPADQGCPAPGPALDVTAPTLGLRLDPSTFKPKGATAISFVLSEAAAVRFTIQRSRTGRRVGGACKRRTKANARNKRCARWVRVAGSRTEAGTAGANTLELARSLAGSRFKPGRYRLTGRATDLAGNASAAERVRFEVVR